MQINRNIGNSLCADSGIDSFASFSDCHHKISNISFLLWTLCLAQAAQISTQIERKRIDKTATATATATSATTTTAYRQCTSQAHEHK